VRAIAFCVVVSTWSLSSFQGLSGVVLDTAGRPVAGAIVRAQGSEEVTRSDAGGRFRLPRNVRMTGRHVTAWAPGYFNAGTEPRPGRPVTITLTPLPSDDHPDYTWVSPYLPSPASEARGGKACESCHGGDRFPLMREWETSAHAKAATSPVFLDFFNGTQDAIPLLQGLGYKSDFPNSSGNCASCHVPALALRKGSAADPNEAAGVERLGVFCDFCHKVAEVPRVLEAGRPGVLSMTLRRPAPGTQLFFGPYDDAFPGADAFNPLYRESRYCAPCHQGRFWNVPVYSEFEEWEQTSYARRGEHCQACHMEPDGRTRRVARQDKGAIERHPRTVANHSFRGARDPGFLRRAIKLETTADTDEVGVEVRVVVTNTGAGHHVPSGSPMRNLLTHVGARAGDGTILPLVAGDRLPRWAGVGDPALGNLADLPGRGYAKVLKALVQYPADGMREGKRVPFYPAPYWRAAAIEADTRLAAEQEDVGVWRFGGADRPGPVTVTVRLIYRRTFRTWTAADRPGVEDVEIARSEVTAQPSARRRIAR
jgi:hypothetical protein